MRSELHNTKIVFLLCVLSIATQLPAKTIKRFSARKELIDLFYTDLSWCLAWLFTV